MTRVVVLLTLGLLAGCGSQETAGPVETTGESTGTSRTLIAASNMVHPPFSSWDAEGNAVGIEVDIVEQAARDLGARVEWVERPFSELLTAIEDGEIDMG